MPGEMGQATAVLGLPAILLSRLGETITAGTGLHFPLERLPDLERSVQAAGAELGFRDADAWLRRLTDSRLTSRELDALICHVTVGETYFFRDPPVFEALERNVIPAFLRDRAGSGWHLRIWCAGCCTGEEPYSIAILLHRMLTPEYRRRVKIIATDVNPRFLRHAERGVYGEWSFRATPAWVRDRYFVPCPDGRLEIRPDIRSMVTFARSSLAGDACLPACADTAAMDIILCRNVLMYFALPHAKMAAARLCSALVEEGWLFVSAAEMSHTLFSEMTVVELAGALAYRRGRTDRIETCRAAPTDAVGVAAPDILSSRSPPPAPPAVTGVRSAPRFDRAARLARQCADGGRLETALEWCERAIAADRLDAAHHYLQAMILRECGDTESAVASLERAVYLDPTFVMAHFGLGHLCLARDRVHDALRHFANARAYALRLATDQEVAESDGLTAGRLVDIVDTLRRSLARSSSGTASI